MPDPAAVLELEHVTKRYGDFHAVDDLGFAVGKGTITGFLGPNGAGKTTTLRMILGILEPTSGRISVLGHPSALGVRDRIGYLPEEKGLYKKMKSWAILAYFATLKGMDRRSAKRRAYELLERHGLGDFADKRTETLSKGMGQKVQVLSAIAHDPELAILDEPFSGLDPVNQQVLEELVLDLRERGRTVLFSTHVMQHAERLCDRIILIAKGRKIFDGTVPEARRSVRQPVRIDADGDVEALGRLPGVLAVRAADPSQADGTGTSWELDLENGADPQRVLQACFEAGIRLRRFDHSEPSLHEVFVRLVGPEAREAAYR